MQKSELRDLVFERFEERRMEIVQKRNRFQLELNQDMLHLREAYGDVAVNGLGDISLALISSGATPPSKDSQVPPTKPSRKRTQSRAKRRRRRQSGAPTVRSILAEHVPAAIAAITEKKEEFRTRDIHDYLTNVSELDIDSNNISLYMSNNAKKLGLEIEKRKEGKPIPRVTNVFRKGRAKNAKNKEKKQAGRVDWEAKILSALKGLSKGLKWVQLKDKLVKTGVPKEKFNGAGFGRALARMVDRGAITLKDDRYRS